MTMTPWKRYPAPISNQINAVKGTAATGSESASKIWKIPLSVMDVESSTDSLKTRIQTY